MNATIYMQSGVAYAITNAASRTNTGGTDRPDPERRSQSAGQRAHDSALVRYQSMFSAAPQFHAGNIGLSTMHGPATAADEFLPFKDLNLGTASGCSSAPRSTT